MSFLLLSVYLFLSLYLLEFLFIYCLTMLFPLWDMLLLSSSTILFFFLSYILGIKFFFFLVLISLSQLYSFFHTLHTPFSLSLLFLLLFFFSSMLLGIDYTTHFLLVSQGGILVPDFCRSVLPCLYVLYSPYMLLLSPLLSIFSLAEVYLWGVYSPSYNIPVFFPI